MGKGRAAAQSCCAPASQIQIARVALLIATVISILGILIAATIDKYALASVLAVMVIQIVLAWCVLKIPDECPSYMQSPESSSTHSGDGSPSWEQ